MKFCCEKLETLYKVPSSYGMNLRVIKLSDEFILESIKRNSPIKKGELYKYIITEGYEDKLLNSTKKLFIEYCPFCGKEMGKLYANDSCINEINHSW